MALDNVQNFARTSLAEDLTNSETGVTVNSASDLPDPANGEYNIVVWDDQAHPNPANDADAEIMRVTAVSSNTLTVTRGQEGTSGTAHSSGYAVANLLTAKIINDIDTELGNKLESEVNDLTSSVTWADVPDANITQSSVTQHESAIDHDSLTNYLANEHIDWTTDQGATNIDTGNITGLSLGTEVTGALTDLSDVNTDKSKTPADGDVLTFDGTDWNAETASGGGVGVNGTPTGGNLTQWTDADTIEDTGASLTTGTVQDDYLLVGNNSNNSFDQTDPSTYGVSNFDHDIHDFSFTIPTDQWAAGLSNAEIGRKVLQSGETLVIDRIELHEDGGGSSNANMSVRVQDVTAATTIGSTNLNTVTKDPGSSGTANTIAIQITNSTGSQVNANVEVTGRVTGA